MFVLKKLQYICKLSLNNNNVLFKIIHVASIC